MIRVLVIDSEPAFLAELERRVTPHRVEWDVQFASPAEAGARLADGAWDVVLADPAPQGTPPVSALAEAKRSQPSAVRIALSRDVSAPQALAVAHQVLPRGCDAAVLRSTITRSVELRSRLSDPIVLGILGSLPSLPSPSTAMVELQAALDAAEVETNRVGRVVSSDMAMSTKLLQIVNSSFYGLARTVEDPIEATRLLGARLVGEILLTVGLLDSVATRGSAVEDQLRAMRERSIARADLAATLAERAGKPTAVIRRVWNGAFLLDIGEMLLIGTEGEHDPDVVAVRATIGGALLEMWGLPHHLVEVVAFADRLPERSSNEASLYGWLANSLLAPESSTEAAAVDTATDGADAGDLVASVARWVGLASVDLSAYRRQPEAAR